MHKLFRIEPILGGGLHCDPVGLASWVDKNERKRPVDMAEMLSLNYDIGALNRPNWWARPMPCNDGITINSQRLAQEGYLFAYESLKAMSDWLDGLEPRHVLDVGAAIRVVNVRKCIKGGKQVIYRPKDVISDFRVVHGGLHQLLKQHR